MYSWGDIMEEKENEGFFAKFGKFTKNEGFVKAIVCAGVLGIALILLSGFFTQNVKNEVKAEPKESISTTLTKYENDLEQGLAEIISSIDGAGKTKVLITMDSTVEQVYAADKNIAQKNSSNTKEADTANNKDITADSSYVTVELSDGTQQTVLVKEIQPKVRGVLVVCGGGDNSVVKEKIIDAVTKALDISSSKVSVAGLTK